MAGNEFTKNNTMNKLSTHQGRAEYVSPVAKTIKVFVKQNVLQQVSPGYTTDSENMIDEMD